MNFPKYRYSMSQDLTKFYHDAGQFYWAKRDAILKNIPQAVTLHFINNEIDMGKKVTTELIDLEISDNLFDIQKKIR